MKLWLVRHAAPEVDAGICYGCTDVAAQQVATHEAACALATQLPLAIAVHCSPLQRCEQLVQAICGLRPDLTFEFDPRLAEMDFGSWEGRRWDSLGEAALAAWTMDFFTHRPGGGESLQIFMGRVGGAFEQIRAARKEAVWITHAGVIRAVGLLSRGIHRIENASQWPPEPIEYGSWLALDC